MSSQEPGRIPNGLKFAFGGMAACSATCFTHPLDLVKNRMQVHKSRERQTSFSLLRHIIKNDGVLGIYTGVTAGWFRQATYATTRLGIYTTLFEMSTGPDGQPPSFLKKAGISMFAGVCGSFVGNPAEVTLIRMTADGTLPVSERRNYSHALNAVFRVSREEGVTTLWRGAVTTMGRAIVVNVAQLTTYSQAKQGLLESKYFKDNIFLHFCASMISGLVTTIASMPVDIAKTRIQNMKIIDGKPEYKGAVDVILKVVRNEGFFAMWKGFTPYYLRVGPHTVLTFIFLEQIYKTYRTYVLGEKNAIGGGI